MCEVSAANFEISLRKYAMKKCIFSASIYMGKFCNLIQIFNNYEGTKCQTIVYKQKIVHFIFHKKIIVKNNNFATQKWRILRPGRIAWERLIESLSKRRFWQHGRQPEVNQAVVDGEWWRQPFLCEIKNASPMKFHVRDFKQELLSPLLAIHNGSIHFRLASVLLKTSLA